MPTQRQQPDYKTRTLNFGDAERCAEIATAISADHGINHHYDAQSFLLEWQQPNFELDRSSIAFENEDGLLVAFAAFWATAETPVHPWFNWNVDPSHRGNGLGMKLLRWADTQGEAILPRCPADARVSIVSGSHKGYAYMEDKFEAAGYVPHRTFYDMRIAMSGRPSLAPLPAGIGLRAYDHEVDLPILVDVVRDSFTDHYGYLEEPFEKELADFRHWLDNDPYFDPELVLLAIDEACGDVVGCLLGLTQEAREPDVGYIDIVGVRRAYRRRGLASALLTRSFAQYWDRDTKIVCLGVDSQSFTDAVALYERVGMRVHREFVAYEKVIRAGVELAKLTK